MGSSQVCHHHHQPSPGPPMPIPWPPPQAPHLGSRKPQDVSFCAWSSDMGKGRSLGHEVMFPRSRGHCHLQSPTFPLKASNCWEFWES